MTTYEPERDTPEELEPEELEPEQLDQPADPFEPEAPAHDDPDPETIVHDLDTDEEDSVDGAEPAPAQPSDGEASSF